MNSALLNPYQLQEADKFSYQFITDAGVTYHVYFLDYSYMFEEYLNLAGNVYSFNVDVIDLQTEIPGTDERIGMTIVQVFQLFFKHKENVTVYVCDSSDERHIARKRKFDLWFSKYNDGSIIKEDGIALVGGIEILNALLIHQKNPRCAEIIFAFKDLNAKTGINKGTNCHLENGCHPERIVTLSLSKSDSINANNTNTIKHRG